MLYTDAGSNVIGILVFLLVVAVLRPDREKLPDEPAEAQPVELPEARIVK
jgi:hypothetical protein